VLHICIPAYNEAPTIGVLLWRIRKVFREYSREYEILVYDDASTDATTETLEPYAEVLPLTVLRGEERRGYGRALDALVRAAERRTRYPRRDAMIVMQADFTDQPEHLPELVKRFEGGADLVVAERAASAAAPAPVRRLRRVAPWVLRPFVSVPGVSDPFGAFRLYRISVLRDLLKAAEGTPVVAGDGWAANVELLVRAAPFARRIETVTLEPRYDVRPRESRIRPFADAMSLYRFGRAARSHRLPPGAASGAPTATSAGAREATREPARDSATQPTVTQ
jgi:glycosyltransferase involved in cell wall biosynthesis